MSSLNINTLKALNESKLIFTIDLNYKSLLQKVIISAMEDFYGIPLEWEDFYYEFLSSCYELLNEYDDRYSVTTFLSSKCRFFVKNKCRVYIGAKHRVLNDYVEATEVVQLSDSKGVYIPIDLSTLNRIEMKVYESVVLDGNSIAESAKRLSLSKFKITNIYDNVLRKLKPQVEKN